MKREHVIRIIAGSFILLSVFLFNTYNADQSIFARPNWLWFVMFVGLNLIQSAFTKWCLMETILKKLGIGSS